MQFILISHIINSYSKQVGTGFFFSSSFWITSTEYWLVFNVLLPADSDAEARGLVLSERGLFQQQRWMTKRRAGRWWWVPGMSNLAGYLMGRSWQHRWAREGTEQRAEQRDARDICTRNHTKSSIKNKDIHKFTYEIKKTQDTILNDRGDSPVEMAQSGTGVKRRSLLFSGSWWSTGESSSHLNSLLQWQHHAYERTHWERSRWGERRRETGREKQKRDTTTLTQHTPWHSCLDCPGTSVVSCTSTLDCVVCSLAFEGLAHLGWL